MGPSSRAVRSLIQAALREDAAFRDATSRAVLPPDRRIRARIVANSRGVASGVKTAALAFTALDPSLRCTLHRTDGASLRRGDAIMTVEGNARAILAAERTALNVLAHLSGIATLTRAYVKRVSGTRARIFDTRKTLPGLRALEKDAVRAGGGRNHRADLNEAILIKTNHLRAIGGDRSAAITRAVAAAKRARPRRFVEVEVATLREFRAALAAGPDAILLDNWRAPVIRRASRDGRRGPLLEASGGVTLATVRAIAKTGVDRISIGRLTHSAPSLDVSLTVIKKGA